MGGSGRAKRAMPTLAAQKARVEDGAPGLCGYGRRTGDSRFARYARNDNKKSTSKCRSRFPSGMTERKARAKAKSNNKGKGWFDRVVSCEFEWVS